MKPSDRERPDALGPQAAGSSSPAQADHPLVTVADGVTETEAEVLRGLLLAAAGISSVVTVTRSSGAPPLAPDDRRQVRVAARDAALARSVLADGTREDGPPASLPPDRRRRLSASALVLVAVLTAVVCVVADVPF